MVTLSSLKNPAHRWIAVKAALEMRGLSLSDIARQIGITRGAVCHTRHRPYPNVERAIADALGLAPQDIWPERYTPEGRPVRSRPNAPMDRHGQRRKTAL